MLNLAQIATPTLLVDTDRARANIARMAQRAQRQSIRFRPHFKTHQSIAMGAWFRAAGVSAITVSSVRMAAYFADAGWDDITIAFPANVRELPAMAALAQRVHLGLLVDSVATVEAIAAAITQPVDLWLEVDAGYRRSGLDAGDVQGCLAILRAAQPHGALRIRGLLTHTGQSYGLQGAAALAALHVETMAQLVALRTALADAGFAGLEVSIGDTPTCSVVDDLGAVDEMRPGNFVFYDWTQQTIGACGEEDIAVAVACPVVATYPARNEVILYGGAVHLSKDFVPRLTAQWTTATPRLWPPAAGATAGRASTCARSRRSTAFCMQPMQRPLPAIWVRCAWVTWWLCCPSTPASRLTCSRST